MQITFQTKFDSLTGHVGMINLRADIVIINGRRRRL